MNIFGYPDGVFSQCSGGSGSGSDQIASTYTAADQFYGKDGTDSKPAYSYTSEHGTGIQKSAAGELSLTSLGSKRLRVSGTQTESFNPFLAQVGTSPQYTFSGASSSGFAYDGTTASLKSGTSASFGVTSAYATSTIPIAVPSTLTQPAFTFTGNTSSGMWFEPSTEILHIQGGTGGKSDIQIGDNFFRAQTDFGASPLAYFPSATAASSGTNIS